MSQEIRNWYEVDSNDHLILWQGVCAVFSELHCELFKLRTNDLYSIRLSNDVSFKCITSTGFWECAEIAGEFSDNQRFLYHAPNADEAERLLKSVEEAMKLQIIRMTVRLDDDPLRLQNTRWINDRLQKWKNVLMKFNDATSKLVIDHNMPL